MQAAYLVRGLLACSIWWVCLREDEPLSARLAGGGNGPGGGMLHLVGERGRCCGIVGWFEYVC